MQENSQIPGFEFEEDFDYPVDQSIDDEELETWKDLNLVI